MSALLDLFMKSKRRLHKWTHYLDIYDGFFSKYRGKQINILEFGVAQGGSLELWRDYFGERCNVYGIDIEPLCKQAESDRIKVYIGSQRDEKFNAEMMKVLPEMDIIIEDASHQMVDQIGTFKNFWPKVKNGGFWVTEDTHTSYFVRHFGGGCRKKGTFIEFIKTLIDPMQAWWSHEPDTFKVDKYTKSVKALHFYSTLVIIEKDDVQEPHTVKVGEVLDMKIRGSK